MASIIFLVLIMATVCYATSTNYTKKDQNDTNEAKDHQHDQKPVEYEFKYEVHDPKTKNYQSRQEKRIGDHVKGNYKLVDPDGYLRTVHYTADDRSGFMAQVQRIPHISHGTHSKERRGQDGDHEKGQLRLVESDGYLRTVEYTADDRSESRGDEDKVTQIPQNTQRRWSWLSESDN